jgi:hypothetical protein
MLALPPEGNFLHHRVMLSAMLRYLTDAVRTKHLPLLCQFLLPRKQLWHYGLCHKLLLDFLVQWLGDVGLFFKLF